MTKRGITANTLKWIAVVTMLIDHFGMTIYGHIPGCSYWTYRMLRYIGRIAFPIYCFLLVEGFFHTKDLKKYIRRCFVFALLSEIPFDLANSGTLFSMQSQNVYFALTTGLMMMFGLEKIKAIYKVPKWLADKLYLEQYRILLSCMCIAFAAGLAQVTELDYHYIGILIIAVLYYCREYSPLIRSLVGAIVVAFEKTAPIAFVFIYFYKGERGKQNKYLFYLIYPVHLLIFGLIRYFYL